MLQPSRALVTGATAGIGQALCYALADKGISLIATGRNKEALLALKQKLEPKTNITTLCADLTNQDDIRKIVATIKTELPELIINNAGMAVYGPAYQTQVNEQLEVAQINAHAPLQLCLEGVQALKKANKRGVILNIASIAGFFPTPGFSVYGASKAFMIHISKGLDFELRSCGIRVLVSCPGQVDTLFSDKAAKIKGVKRKGPLLSVPYTVKRMLSQIEKGKGVDLFDWRYHLMARLVPECLAKRGVWKNISSRLG